MRIWSERTPVEAESEVVAVDGGQPIEEKVVVPAVAAVTHPEFDATLAELGMIQGIETTDEQRTRFFELERAHWAGGTEEPPTAGEPPC